MHRAHAALTAFAAIQLLDGSGLDGSGDGRAFQLSRVQAPSTLAKRVVRQS